MAPSYWKFQALYYIDLKTETGLYRLLGPNGAGKKALMKILSTILPFVFTDTHAIRRLSNFYTDLSYLDKIASDVMDSNYWNDTDEHMNRKARRQAEFLVHGQVPLAACLGLAVYNYDISFSVPVLMINSYSVDENEAKGGCCVFNQGHVEKELPIGEKGVLIVNL